MIYFNEATPLLNDDWKKMYLKVVDYNYSNIILPAYKKIIKLENLNAFSPTQNNKN